MSEDMKIVIPIIGFIVGSIIGLWIATIQYCIEKR